MKIFFQLIIIGILNLFLVNFIQISYDHNFIHLISFQSVDLISKNQTFYEDMLVHNVIEETTELFIEKKIIYIYNTHQTEKYQTNSVMDGARYLQSLLIEKGYEVIFEESNFDQYKRENNMDLTETYPTSRIFLNKNIEKYGPFDLIIDFHRDALSRENSYVTINGKNYAKLMMVIGNDSSNKDSVRYNSQILHLAVDEILDGIMRNDFSRDYAVYNQDVAQKMLLIEFGGNTSTFSEVQNSIEIIAEAIDVCLKEDRFI